jgi:dihydroneopterin aldolase/D-erythro-7,8-dihydroneopterin triphosphate epimerase
MADRPLDKIYVRDLVCRCIIGINPEERTNKQDVTINLVLEADLSAAGQTDDIADTVDYKQIKKNVLRMAEGSSFLLVERLAQRVADICLECPEVIRAHVTIDKPGALRFARSVAVEITRDRQDHA